MYEIIQYAVDTGEGPKEETILSFGSGREDAGRCHGPHTTERPTIILNQAMSLLSSL